MRSILSPRLSRWFLLVLVFVTQFACKEPYTAPRFEGAGSATPVRGGTFRFAFDTDLRTLDPAQAYDELSTAVVRHLFDGLVDYDPTTGEVVPQLAERFEQAADGLSYTFYLRANLRFSDGTILDAHAVARSLERMLDPRKVPCPGTSFYHLLEGADDFAEGRAPHVRGIVVRDARTLVMRLTQRDQTFLNAMAMPFAAPVPTAYAARVGNDHFARNPIGAGPFVLEAWESGSRVVLRRNPNYWDPSRPYLDRIVVELSLARHLQFMRFQRGDMDHATNYTLNTADYLMMTEQRAWRPYLKREPDIAMYGLSMNVEVTPFQNVHLRRAVAFAIDRDSIARSRNYRIVPLGGLYPPGLPGYDAHLPGAHTYDLARARTEMRLAGYPDGYPNEIELWLTEGDAAVMYGQLIQADLRRIGIRIRLRFASFPVYLDTTQRRRAVAMSFAGWNMDFPDPSNFIDTLFHSRNISDEHAQNQSFYANPALDALLDRARIEPNRARRIAMYQEAERMLVTDAPWAFLFASTRIEVEQPYVHRGASSPVYPHEFRNTWLDLPRRPFTGNVSPR
ncbi:MAG: ABC transporter substrate-binding protein [Deltaproteobacteria bacterium]|nr:ABC transporter substrate-binding protein [Deltaproteobacteria bacterium]